MYQVETLDARNYSAADVRAIAELLVLVWPKPGKTVEVRQEQLLELGRGFNGPEEQHPRSLVIRDQGRVIAHAAMIPRTIGTSAGDLTIAGLSRVCSDPAYRGQGLGEIVVRQVFGLVDNGLFPFSLFQTNNTVRPFYEKLGASVVTNEIVNPTTQDLHASAFWDEVAMRYPKDRDWPEGTIDLRGPGY